MKVLNIGFLAKNVTLQRIIFLSIVSVFFLGCEAWDTILKDTLKSPSPFMATVEDFANYKAWQSIDYTIGATNPALGAAHIGNSDAYSRRVYIKSPGQKEGGEYPIGTIFVKETFTWENGKQQFANAGGVLAMVKRGGDFNKSGGGWEWFEVSPDLFTIVGRGGEEMMGGMCNSCHALANAQPGGADGVFPHPSEYAVTDAHFSAYRTWTQIDESSAPHPILGGAHKSNDPNAVRRVYKKQILANPDTEAQGYPTGTTLLKEITQNNIVTEITVMVKRGSGFNAEHGGWEWFMLDPSTLAIIGRGADLMGGMCNACHESAEEPTYGVDYVFKHANAPFNH